jgi:hypothetical protein
VGDHPGLPGQERVVLVAASHFLCPNCDAEPSDSPPTIWRGESCNRPRKTAMRLRASADARTTNSAGTRSARSPRMNPKAELDGRGISSIGQLGHVGSRRICSE